MKWLYLIALLMPAIAMAQTPFALPGGERLGVGSINALGALKADVGPLTAATGLDLSGYADGAPAVRTGLLTNASPAVVQSSTYGSEADDVTLSVLANMDARSTVENAGRENKVEVMGGLYQVSMFNTYGQQDSVGLYVANQSPLPIGLTVAGTFDATHFYPATPLTAATLATLKPGMMLSTSNGTTPYEAHLLSWAVDGTSLTTTSYGWGEPSKASPGDGADPTAVGATMLDINKVGNIYGANINVYANQAYNTQATGVELSVFNQTGHFTPATTADLRGSLPLADGFHAFASGGSASNAAFAAYPGSEGWLTSFAAESCVYACFYSAPISFLGAGFLDVGAAGYAIEVQPGSPTPGQTPGLDTFRVTRGSGTIYTRGGIQFWNAAGTTEIAFIAPYGQLNVPSATIATISHTNGYRVPNLPTCTPGDSTYAIDVRNPGEGVGLGSGNYVSCNSANVWVTYAGAAVTN